MRDPRFYYASKRVESVKYIQSRIYALSKNIVRLKNTRRNKSNEKSCGTVSERRTMMSDEALSWVRAHFERHNLNASEEWMRYVCFTSSVSHLSKGKATSNKIVHMRRYCFLAQFFMAFDMM